MMPPIVITRTPEDALAVTITLSHDEAEGMAQQFAAALGLTLARVHKSERPPLVIDDEPATYPREGLLCACGHGARDHLGIMSSCCLVFGCACRLWRPTQDALPDVPQDRTYLAPEEIAAIPDDPPATLVEPGIHILHEGAVLCCGLPRDTRLWPEGHSWVALAGWDRATCSRCRNVAAGLLPWGAMHKGAAEAPSEAQETTEGETGVASHAVSEGNLEAASGPKQALADEAFVEGFFHSLGAQLTRLADEGSSAETPPDTADVPGDATVLEQLHSMLGTVYTVEEIALALDRAQVPLHAPYARWMTEVERAMTFLPRTKTQGNAQE